MTVLNFDIFTYVLKHLSSQEALRLSTVCRAAHSFVVCQVLSRGIVLETIRQILFFPQFIWADPITRLPFFWKLTLKVHNVTHTADYLDMLAIKNPRMLMPLDCFASFLTQVLTRFPYLRALEIPLSGFFFVRYPILRHALIAYGHLVELTLHDITDNVLHMIKDMRSDLRVLSLWQSLDRPPNPGPPFFSFLTTHPHLEKLAFFAKRDDAVLWELTTPFQWHSVRELQIRGQASLDTIVAACPNLRILRADEIGPWKNSSPSTQWIGLDHLNGDCTDLCNWKIKCPVRWLELSDPIRGNLTSLRAGYVDHTADMADLVRWTKPMILTFTTYHNTPEYFWERLARVARRIKLLELIVYNDLENEEGSEEESEEEFEEGSEEDERHDEDDMTEDEIHEKYEVLSGWPFDVRYGEWCVSLIRKWVTKVPPWLGKLSVPYLCISFQGIVDDLEFDDIADTLKDVHHILAKSLPHVRYFAISVGAHFEYRIPDPTVDESSEDIETEWRDERTWWRVRRDGGEAVPELIPRWKGERLRDRLHSMDYKSLWNLKPDDVELDL